MIAKTLFKSLPLSQRVFVSLLSFGSITIASPSLAASLDVGSWNKSGDVLQSTGQATLTNADFNDDNSNFNVSGSEPSYISDLEDFLGLNQEDLGSDATEGSAIQTALNVVAGDVFSFDWNFITNDDLNDDRAFVTLVNSAIGNTIIPLTGSSRFSYTFTNTGNYNVGIGVVDVNDVVRSSRLSVSNANLEPVPEPLTILGSMTALALGVGMRRRAQRKNLGTDK